MGMPMWNCEQKNSVTRWQRGARVAGPLIAATMTLWFLLGILGFAPSLIEVFGAPDVKIPAAIVVAGLLIAAVGYWDE